MIHNILISKIKSKVVFIVSLYSTTTVGKIVIKRHNLLEKRTNSVKSTGGGAGATLYNRVMVKLASLVESFPQPITFLIFLTFPALLLFKGLHKLSNLVK